MNDQELYDTLHFDPLNTAENITGQSYKTETEDGSMNETSALGLMLMWEKNRKLNESLTERGDTTFSNTLERYVDIIARYGFEKVLDIPFTKGEYAEHQFVYWHDMGLLLEFDTYQEVNVNGGTVYYAWRPDSYEESWRYTSSHDGFKDAVFMGHHDCREALIFNLENLRTHGTFLNPWPRAQRLSLSHHGDGITTSDPGWQERLQAIRDERTAMLPEYVRSAIGGVQ